MYMTTRDQMSSIMELIGPKLFELSALELENLLHLTYVYSLASANINQSVPNLGTIHLPKRAQISSIMAQIEPEHPELFALEFGKIAESDFVYTLASTLASTNIDQSAPNFVRMYMIIRSRMSVIMDLIGPELSQLSALENRKFAIFDSVYTLASADIDQSVPNLATIYIPIKSRTSSIIGQIEIEHPELFVLEFGKNC